MLLYYKLHIHCVNTGNYYTGQSDQSHQMIEKVVLCFHQEEWSGMDAFMKWRIILSSCPDNMTSRHRFRLAHVVCRYVFTELLKFEKKNDNTYELGCFFN